MGDRPTPTELGASFELRIGLNCWPSSCGSQSRKSNATPRGGLQLDGARCSSAGGELSLRANSAIPFGIAVLGRSDALAARGGRAEDEAHRKEAVLLRLKGSPGLRRGIFDARAGRRSPNSTELG